MIIELPKEKRGENRFKAEPFLIEKMPNYSFSEAGEITIKTKDLKEFNAKVEECTVAILAIETMKEFKVIANNTVESIHPQGSKGWLQDRLQGLTTGSDSIFTQTGKPISDLDGYTAKKFVSALTQSEDSFTIEMIQDSDKERKVKNDLMERGNDMEPHALKEYYSQRPHLVESNYSLVWNKAHRVGVSVDSVAIDTRNFKETIIEIKSPKLSTYLKHVKSGYLRNRYYAQIQLQMLVMGIPEAELVVYHPVMKLHITKIELDVEFAVNALIALKKYNELYNKYQEIYNQNKKEIL